jgi:peptide/nickel transport system substrate-binding protein
VAPGCSDDDDNGTTTDAGPDTIVTGEAGTDGPLADGAPPATEIIIGTSEQLTSLDPAEAYQTAAFEVLININHPLYIYDPDTLDYVPALASGEPVISDGGKKWQVPLREGLTFADGTPFDANAVKYSIDRAIAREGQPFYLVADYVESVAVIDDNTVEFTLNTPVAFFKSLLATPAYMPVNKSIYPAEKLLTTPFTEAAQDAAWKDSYIDQNTVDPTKLMGLGPYILDKIEVDETTDPANKYYGAYTQLTFKANPNFYGEAPKTETIIVKYYKDSDALNAAITAKEIHVAWTSLTNDALETLAADADYEIIESAGLITEFLNLNHRLAPFDNENIRKAMAYAIDRAKITDEVWKLTGMPLYSMVPKGLWSHTESFKTDYGADPDTDQVKSMLEAEGFSDNNQMKLEIWYSPIYPNNKPMSEIIEQTLESTGVVDVTLKEEDWDTYVTNLVNVDTGTGLHDHTYQAFWMGWSPDYGDPDNFVYMFAHSDVDLLGCSYFNTAMDTLLDEARTETTYETRRTKYKEIQNLWSQDVVSIPIAQHTKQAVVLKEYSLDPPGTDTLLHYATVHKK